MIFKIAWRYLRGKKSTQAIQIISWVSMVAMAVGTAALIIVLSVFNGFESFIQDLYTDFYPDIRMTARQGKYLKQDEAFEDKLLQLPGITAISHTLDEKVLLSFDASQVIATVKGIDRAYDLTTHFSQKIRYGSLPPYDSVHYPPMVLGLGISNKLGANEESGLPIRCYAFRKEAIQTQTDVSSVYNSLSFMVSGIYMLQEEIDQQYAFTHLATLQELCDEQGMVSSLELKLDPEADADAIKQQIGAIAEASGYTIETRYEQNRTLYFIMKSERWAVFAILTLMLFIASFNIVGSLSMLVIEKSKDIAIFQAMGMPIRQVRRIFITSGILMAVIGAGLGSILALLILLGQQHFGWIRLGQQGSFLLDAYPVEIRWTDFILIYSTVILLAVLAAWMPASRVSRLGKQLKTF